MKTRRFVVVMIGAIVLGRCTLPGESHATVWDQKLRVTERFIVLAAFDNEAVRDNETGLVWEMTPQKTPETWLSARFTCANKVVGGRKGWRLPSLPELASLVDPSVAPASPGPTLPAGHPFTDVQSDFYWSATRTPNLYWTEDPQPIFGFTFPPTFHVAPRFSWAVHFGSSNVSIPSPYLPFDIRVWCVRGGMNADTY